MNDLSLSLSLSLSLFLSMCVSMYTLIIFLLFNFYSLSLSLSLSPGTQSLSGASECLHTTYHGSLQLSNDLMKSNMFKRGSGVDTSPSQYFLSCPNPDNLIYLKLTKLNLPKYFSELCASNVISEYFQVQVLSLSYLMSVVNKKVVFDNNFCDFFSANGEKSSLFNTGEYL